MCLNIFKKKKKKTYKNVVFIYFLFYCNFYILFIENYVYMYVNMSFYFFLKKNVSDKCYGIMPNRIL